MHSYTLLFLWVAEKNVKQKVSDYVRERKREN